MFPSMISSSENKMKLQFSGYVILYGYGMSPGQFSSKKRTYYDFFGYGKNWPYYQSRIKCPLFGGKKLKWCDDNKHPTRPHTILKN